MHPFGSCLAYPHLQDRRTPGTAMPMVASIAHAVMLEVLHHVVPMQDMMWSVLPFLEQYGGTRQPRRMVATGVRLLLFVAGTCIAFVVSLANRQSASVVYAFSTQPGRSSLFGYDPIYV